MAAVAGATDGGKLKACPGSPNCVCSDDTNADHAIEPFRLGGHTSSAAWSALRQALTSEPRTTIIEDSGTYIRAEARSALFRFVDDVEFSLRADEGLIAVRSASRVGYSDLGVNRKRIERLRSALPGNETLE